MFYRLLRTNTTLLAAGTKLSNRCIATAADKIDIAGLKDNYNYCTSNQSKNDDFQTLYDHRREINTELDNHYCWEWTRAANPKPIKNTAVMAKNFDTLMSNVKITDDYQSIHRITLHYDIPDTIDWSHKSLYTQFKMQQTSRSETEKTKSDYPYNLGINQVGDIVDDVTHTTGGMKYNEKFADQSYVTLSNKLFEEALKNQDVIMFELNLFTRKISVWKNNENLGFVYDFSRIPNFSPCEQDNGDIENTFQLTVQYRESKYFETIDGKMQRRNDFKPIDGPISVSILNWEVCNPQFVVAHKKLHQISTIMNHYCESLLNVVTNVNNSCDIVSSMSPYSRAGYKDFETVCQTLQQCESVLFPKLINDIKKAQVQLSAMNKKIAARHKECNFANWCVADILIWIEKLENGLFKQHIPVLEKGFIDDYITGNDLQYVTKDDLLRYGIKIFAHRRKLEQHFQKLVHVRAHGKVEPTIDFNVEQSLDDDPRKNATFPAGPLLVSQRKIPF